MTFRIQMRLFLNSYRAPLEQNRNTILDFLHVFILSPKTISHSVNPTEMSSDDQILMTHVISERVSH